MLTFYLSLKSLTSIAVAQLTDISENTVSEWKILLHVHVADWLMANHTTLRGPGVIVELDEAKFGKRKYNKGAYREVGCSTLFIANIIRFIQIYSDLFRFVQIYSDLFRFI